MGKINKNSFRLHNVHVWGTRTADVIPRQTNPIALTLNRK